MLRPVQHLDCLLIKPVGPACNLKCEYCFYLEKENIFSSPATMKEEVLDATMRQALKTGNHPFSFIWQGGEPLLAGLDFFRRAVELQKKYGGHRTVSNAIQTNGTLLNRDWANFFNDNDFLVGVSLDGPQSIHDYYRRDIGAKGTWSKVHEGAKLCLKQGVATNILSCVTPHSQNHSIELYDYYKREGFRYLQFIPVIETDKNGEPTSFSVAGKAYGKFLTQMFNHWLSDFENGQPTMSIRLFDTLFFTVLGRSAPECSLHETCGSYLTVEHTGEMFPCDFFVEPVHSRGNILEYDPHQMINSNLQRLFGGAKANLPKQCAKCKWKPLCNGGCLKDRRNNPRNQKENYFCRAMKDFLPYAVPHFEALAKRWQG